MAGTPGGEENRGAIEQLDLGGTAAGIGMAFGGGLCFRGFRAGRAQGLCLRVFDELAVFV